MAMKYVALTHETRILSNRPLTINDIKRDYHINFKNFDFRHMKQHEQDDYVDFSKMSESEVIMHHFKQFDHDKDGKLDGLEVLKQIQKQNGKLKNIALDV